MINEITPGLAFDTYRKAKKKGKEEQSRRLHGSAMQRINAVTNSPQFKQWFNGSKVVDSNGRPILCYHGSGTTFTGGPMEEFGLADEDRGSWFTESEHYSALYIRGDELSDDGSRMYCVFLKCVNPFELSEEIGDELYIDEPWFKTPIIQEFIKRLNVNEESFVKNIENDKTLMALDFVFQVTNTQTFQNYVKAAGYDSLHSIESGASCWCPFDNSQICAFNLKDKNKRPFTNEHKQYVRQLVEQYTRDILNEIINKKTTTTMERLQPKKRIRLTEKELHCLIESCVKETLQEGLCNYPLENYEFFGIDPNSPNAEEEYRRAFKEYMQFRRDRALPNSTYV